MLQYRVMTLAVLAGLGLSSVASAATEDDLKDLREQVRQLKAQYEKRIGALEQRLKDAEQSAAQAGTVAASASDAANRAAVQASQATQSIQSSQGMAQAVGRTAGESAFNPAVSLILNGTYGRLSRDPSGFRINGFAPTRGEVGPPHRGFSLGESELMFSANIDPNFRGTLIAALSPDEKIGVEEGFIQTLGLSNGLTLKAGRFFSAVGYQNEIHAHAWDFVDAPLVNKVFLGNQFADDGVQLKWVAPTDTYIDLGVEAGRGRKFPGGPDGGRSKNGVGAGVVFAHIGGDIGASTAWKLGLSHLRTTAQERSYNDTDSTGTTVTNNFNGSSRLWGLGGVLK